MLDTVRQKIRALIEDFSGTDFEVFEYTISSIFTISQENIVITQVLKNGVAIGSGDYSFDSTNNKITILTTLISGDNIEVDYNYYKYSDTELNEYVRASLVWLSIFSYCETDYELESNFIYPTPTNKTLDLISLISSILVKPDYNEYSLPNIKVKYPRKITKEEKIEELIKGFQTGLGVNCLLEFD